MVQPVTHTILLPRQKTEAVLQRQMEFAMKDAGITPEQL